MKKIILICILFLNATVISNADLGAYVINDYKVNINVKENNILEIEEKIEVNFEKYRHGIYRIIPTKNLIIRPDGSKRISYSKVNNIKIKNLVDKKENDEAITLKIGNKNKTFIGEKEYIIKYDYYLENDENEGFDELYFNIIGNNWDTEIKKVDFKITLPKSFDESKVGFVHGLLGSTDKSKIKYKVDNNQITGGILNLEPREGLTIRVELDDGYFVKRKFNLLLFFKKYSEEILIFITTLLTYTIFYNIWKKYGDDEEVIAITTYNSPDDLTPLELDYLENQNISDKSILALIVLLANKGYINIEDSNETMNIKKAKKYDGSDNIERLFMEEIFSNKDVINSKKDVQHFSKTIAKVKKEFNSKNKKRINKKYFTEKSLKIKKIMGVFVLVPIMFLIMKNPIYMHVLIIVFSFYEMYRKKLLSLPIFIMTIVWLPLLFLVETDGISYVLPVAIAAFFWYYMDKTNEKGHMLKNKIAGFKDFLDKVEKPKLEELVKKNPKYFYDILPYTYVLGVSHEWIHKMEGFLTVEEVKNVRRQKTFVNNVQTNINRSNISSSGGFSGGGFSGGGSGGGGGGSW